MLVEVNIFVPVMYFDHLNLLVFKILCESKLSSKTKTVRTHQYNSNNKLISILTMSLCNKLRPQSCLCSFKEKFCQLKHTQIPTWL